MKDPNYGPKKHSSLGGILCTLVWSWLAIAGLQAQEPQPPQEPVPPQPAPAQPAAQTVAQDGRIIIVDGNWPQEVPVFFKGDATAVATVERDKIRQTVTLNVDVVQGEPERLTFGLMGAGVVREVTGQGLQAWAVRQAANQRFLDLQVTKDTKKLTVKVAIETAGLELPATQDLTHLTPGDAVGFSSEIRLNFAPEVRGKVVVANGFLPVEGEQSGQRFQTATGGRLTLDLAPSEAVPGAVEVANAEVSGTVSVKEGFAALEFRGTAIVSEPDAELEILSGNAAFSEVPRNAPYKLKLVQSKGGEATYQLVFSQPGSYPLNLDFVAQVKKENEWTGMDFTLSAGTVVPLVLTGIDREVEFQEATTVVPVRNGNTWQGYLPVTGRSIISWKPSRKAGEGKLFFTTEAAIEARVGAGLLRQDVSVDFRVLQGELDKLSFQLEGAGEVLDVQGPDLLRWEVAERDGGRFLDVTLSQPMTQTGSVRIRSQNALQDLPVRVQPMRVTPVGAVRHSGYVRLSNQGSVRLEPASLTGLTQLAPDQYPNGDSIDARQVFVYRFPSATYSYGVAADRIQPEVNVSAILIYQLAETDRVLRAEIELDIREAAIREWDLEIPSDYSVVAVAGPAVADHVVASEEADGRRLLKLLFGEDVIGRQLVSLHLEKNEAAAAGDWVLPPLRYPDAKSVRGDLGIVGAPGFRIGVGEVLSLSEKPLSAFPQAVENLQQAFRVRDRDWTATMQVELLEKNIQADVFHLYSLSSRTSYGSALLNYFVTGAPVGEWQLTVPADLENVAVEGKDIRTWRREDDTVFVSLHQPVIGPYTLLITFEESVENGDTLQPGRVTPVDVQGESGYIQLVSPEQVQAEVTTRSDQLLELDALELPAEFRLLSSAPSLAAFQYTARPFDLQFTVGWFDPGTTVDQVVEFSEVLSNVSPAGELSTELTYYVKTRGQSALRLEVPANMELWKVAVDGQTVNARRDGDATLIPLPGGSDPNVPMRINVVLAKPVVPGQGARPILSLPKVEAPILKTEWRIQGNEGRVLIPVGGTESIQPKPQLRESGFRWLASQDLKALALAIVVLIVGAVLCRRPTWLGAIGMLFILGGIWLIWLMAMAAYRDLEIPAGSLQLSLPVLTPGETVELQVKSVEQELAGFQQWGMILAILGLVALGASLVPKLGYRLLLSTVGALLVACGVLVQPGGAPWFLGALALLLLVLVLIPAGVRWCRDVGRRFNAMREARRARKAAAASTTTAVILALAWLSWGETAEAKDAPVVVPDGYAAADSMAQEWQLKDKRLQGSAEIRLSGQPGDRYILLKAPAVLTRFDGEGLRLVKQNVPGQGMAYVASIISPPADQVLPQTFVAELEFQLEVSNPENGFALPTGAAAMQRVEFAYDKAGWDFVSNAAVRIEPLAAADGGSKAALLLAPRANSTISLKPLVRDVSEETTEFYVETTNLYLPGPGVVDGRHRFEVRPSQGQVRELKLQVPQGLTVSAVTGPVGSWQFDAESGALQIAIEPAQGKSFSLMVETQRGLDPLPSDANLSPVRVEGARGEVGLIGVAFGPDAQPEKVESVTLTQVNLGDFDASLIPGEGKDKAVLHRVYRYGSDGGALALRVAPVAPEVRVTSKQVISLGDERMVLAVNLVAEITRAGLFQLSFPLPDGLEVESLTGPALHHWSELEEDGNRRIVLHLNGKTLGAQSFSVTLVGQAPTDTGEWEVPRFVMTEAIRQTGEIIVRPTTGIRLRTISRQNVSEVDPRTLGGTGQGALAFRLLQKDWDLNLGIEKLEPWVIAQVLHEIMLREGQTRSVLVANLTVQNASIPSLQVQLPGLTDEVATTVRASGSAVKDFVRTAADSDIWELQFKRRVVGNTQVRIEFESRGDRDQESLTPVGFPDVRQLSYYYAIRTGHLELQLGDFPQGWQRADWNAVPSSLRQAGNRTSPALTLRTQSPDAPLVVTTTRHSLAEALRLRVLSGQLTTVLSPLGDELTAMDLQMEVIQRSSLVVNLPPGGTLFSIFVNGESVSSVRQGDAYQFYILPGPDDRSARVRVVYEVPKSNLRRTQLAGPLLNVPLENITWRVVVPRQYELIDNSGDLDLEDSQRWRDFDEDTYLVTSQSERAAQAKQAEQLLERANDFLQKGEQTKARLALNSVANQYALDAASNEDARVQLENLQTQQAVVGLNTRRQRVYLDNGLDDAAFAKNEQLEQGAAQNRVLNDGVLNYRPQELSQLLQGNTSEDNAVLQRIATRLVKHQKITEPAPRAITITLPEEGTVYSFRRTVHVSGNTPLKLDLKIARVNAIQRDRLAVVLGFVFVAAMVLVVRKRKVKGKG